LKAISITSRVLAIRETAPLHHIESAFFRAWVLSAKWQASDGRASRTAISFNDQTSFIVCNFRIDQSNANILFHS
jgi:hypothetical protein